MSLQLENGAAFFGNPNTPFRKQCKPKAFPQEATKTKGHSRTFYEQHRIPFKELWNSNESLEQSGEINGFLQKANDHPTHVFLS